MQDWRFEMVIKALYGDVRTYDAEVCTMCTAFAWYARKHVHCQSILSAPGHMHRQLLVCSSQHAGINCFTMRIYAEDHTHIKKTYVRQLMHCHVCCQESALLASSSLPPAASPTAAGSSATHTSSPAAAHQGNNQNHGAGSHPASHQDHHTHGPQRHKQQHAGHSGSGHVAHAATGHAPSHSHGRGSNHHSTSAGRGQAQPSQTASPSRKHSAHTHQGGASEQEGVGISLHARQSFDIHSQLDVVPKLAPKLSDAVDMATSPVASPKAQQNPPGTLNGSLNARQHDCNASSGGAAQQQRLWLPEPMSKRRRVLTSTRLGRVTFASFGSLVESQTEVAGPSVYEALSPVSSKVCVYESPGLNLSGLSRLSLASPKRKGAKYLCASRLSVQQAAPTSACEARMEVENSPACNSHHAAACGVATSPSPSPRRSRPYIQGFQYMPFTNPELQPPTPTAVACVPAPRQPQGMCHVRTGLLWPLVDGLRRDSGSSCSSRSQSMSPSQPAPFARLQLPVRQVTHTQGAQVLHAPQPSSAAAASTTSTAHILRAPSACSAAGLGMRHPGMVLVHLRPADDPPPSTAVTSSLRAPSPMPGKHADMDSASNPSMQCMSNSGGIGGSHLHSFPSSGQDTASLVVQGAVARPGCSVQGSFERDVPCSGGYKNLPALGKPFCLVPTKWTVTQLELVGLTTCHIMCTAHALACTLQDMLLNCTSGSSLGQMPLGTGWAGLGAQQRCLLAEIEGWLAACLPACITSQPSISACLTGAYAHALCIPSVNDACAHQADVQLMCACSC